ncbi:Uncharacterised protein [Mycobacterium tuberculosis]|uniref:Uncharacterized protein n=1 Tax=Mycobacterium tuberculosis TaxID=1773 RepID=A0A0U0QPS2_MYCTX|nr:Uncharacterised protein [Mycobacterium tuberculosis]COV17804.1 Uncharacterised protein [Mycobacterium tuberculosis]COW66848.1 Uncharacterised protein [Mycobacterium tuberculosis]
MPSIRDDVGMTMSYRPSEYAGKNAEFSGSTTHSRVACRR